MTQIHVGRDGKQFGPYEEDQARTLYAQGGIVPTDLVWREGMAGWQPASQLFGPQPSQSGAPPLPFGAPPVPFPGSTASPTGPAAPGYAAPHPAYTTPAGAQALPLPPKLHWALVLLFSLVTLGIFGLVWAFLQSSWVRRIDPTSNARSLFVGYLALSVLSAICNSGALQYSQGANAVGSLCELAAIVVFIVGAFSMRRSLVTYFNTVEPIGLRMSGVMTFFFTLLYMQHHLTRIAEWKTTGVLRPQ